MTTPPEDAGILSPGAEARPWQAQIDVNTDRARRLIRARFPGISTDTITPFGRGWDNTAFLVDGSMVFRFPRRDVAAPLLETEARTLPVVARAAFHAVSIGWYGIELGDETLTREAIAAMRFVLE